MYVNSDEYLNTCLLKDAKRVALDGSVVESVVGHHKQFIRGRLYERERKRNNGRKH